MMNKGHGRPFSPSEHAELFRNRTRKSGVPMLRDANVILKQCRDAGFQEAGSHLSLDELRLVIDKADAAYYRKGLTQIATDHEYDLLKTWLRAVDANDERLTRVGMAFDAEEIGNKVRHNIPMGSLDNTDDGVLGFEPWLDSMKVKLGVKSLAVMASLKIDGGSVCATYEDGQLVRVATRGNGDEGEDITANAIRFSNLPLVLSEKINVDVRGEAILFVDDYKAIRSSELGVPFDQIPEADRSNPRNIGNGILGRHNGQDSDKIAFLAFNLIIQGREFATESEKLDCMKKLGFVTVPHVLCESVDDFMAFYSETVEGRAAFPMEIDGIVVVVNDIVHQNTFVTDDPKTKLRPKYARAVKFPHKSNTTVIKDVLVTVGHTRMIIPTAVLEEVRIGGVNVTSALLNNYTEIERLDVAIGDTVEVVLAGDIIPKVIRKVKDGLNRIPITEPSSCPACSAPTTRTLRGKAGACTYCTNPKCSAAAFSKLDCWIGGSKKGVGILDIGDTMIKALWDKGLLVDPADLYTLTVDGIKDVTIGKGGRIGLSRAEKIVANVSAKKHLPLHTFLGSLGIELLGRRRVVILRDAADGQLDKLEDWLDTAKLQTLQIAGLGDTIRSSIIQGIEDNKQLIEKLLANGVTIDYGTKKVAVDESGDKPASAVAGRTFCWTGTRDLVEETIAAGGVAKSGISKGLDFLVQKDPLSKSVKTQKAESYGTKIIGVDFLRTVLAGQAELP